LDAGKLLEAIPSAVFSVDPSLHFRFANGAAEQLFGASWNVLARRSLWSSRRKCRSAAACVAADRSEGSAPAGCE
jgi:nitrogen-specific signal transduction histidine kinase